MTIHLSLFVPALLLLLFPADRLLSSRVELRDFESFHTLDRPERYRPWWWVASLWVDPVRGFVGAGMLAASLDLMFGRWDVPPTPELALAAAVIAAAVVAQIVTWRERGVLLAPIGFATGIVAFVAPWYVTVIATTMAMVAMWGVRQFFAFFVAGGATAGFLAFVADTGTTWTVLALVALGLPAVASLVTGRAMEIPTRNSSGPRPAAPVP